MDVSTPAIPSTIQISRSRLVGMILAVAAVAAAITGVVVAFTVGTSSAVSMKPALTVRANANRVPLTASPGALFGPIAKRITFTATAPPEALFGPIAKRITFTPTAPPEAMFGPITPS